MGKELYQPVFLKAHIAFTVDKHMLNFKERNITPYGAHSLAWTPLSPKKHFGRRAIANLRILTSNPINLQVPARITREHSFYGEQMGLKFDLSQDDRKILTDLVDQEGYHPSEYARKYPRIPASAEISSFPLRALVHPQNPGNQTIPLIFDVSNISIGGVLIRSENPFVVSIQLGQSLQLYLEPRGDLPLQVILEGQVCRILEDLNPENGNLIRMFGVKFTQISQENRHSFMELLRDILERIQPKS
jgi:hypothetical protein